MTASRLPSFLAAALLLLLAGCNSKPWASRGQECGSPCWPGPRIGCQDACLLAPCPPEPYCKERPKKRCPPKPCPPKPCPPKPCAPAPCN